MRKRKAMVMMLTGAAPGALLVGRAAAMGVISNGYSLSLIWSGDSASWCSRQSAIVQLNTSSKTYLAVAIRKA